MTFDYDDNEIITDEEMRICATCSTMDCSYCCSVCRILVQTGCSVCGQPWDDDDIANHAYWQNDFMAII